MCRIDSSSSVSEPCDSRSNSRSTCSSRCRCASAEQAQVSDERARKAHMRASLAAHAQLATCRCHAHSASASPTVSDSLSLHAIHPAVRRSQLIEQTLIQRSRLLLRAQRVVIASPLSGSQAATTVCWIQVHGNESYLLSSIFDSIAASASACACCASAVIETVAVRISKCALTEQDSRLLQRQHLQSLENVRVNCCRCGNRTPQLMNYSSSKNKTTTIRFKIGRAHV